MCPFHSKSGGAAPPADKAPVASAPANSQQTLYDKEFPPLPNKQNKSQAPASTQLEQTPDILCTSASIAAGRWSLSKKSIGKIDPKKCDSNERILEPL